MTWSCCLAGIATSSLLLGGLKTNGVRLCGDIKVTINPNVIHDHYPLPNSEDMFASLNGGKVFSKIDLTHAYQQLVINEASKQYLTDIPGVQCYLDDILFFLQGRIFIKKIQQKTIYIYIYIIL